MGEVVLSEKVYTELIEAAKEFETKRPLFSKRLLLAIEAAEKDALDGSDYIRDNSESSDREPLRHED